MRKVGRHLIIELYDCEPSILSDADRLREILRGAVLAINGKICGDFFHKFDGGGGVSGVIAMAESHISIHTWPEYGYAARDVFTCGSLDPDRAYSFILEQIRPGRSSVMRIERGVEI